MTLNTRNSDPELVADDEGVWRISKSGSKSGIRWDEVYCISGYKFDGITEEHTVLELDFVYGAFVELHEGWQGFGTVVEAIGMHFPHLNSDWFSRVKSLRCTDESLVILRQE